MGGATPLNAHGTGKQDLRPHTLYEELMERMAERCKTMGSYAEAEPMLMEVMTMAVREGAATPLMAELADGVKQFFVEKNKPAPSNVYQNCTIVQGDDMHVGGSYLDVHDNKDVGNQFRI